jgi:hypothetical protein
LSKGKALFPLLWLLHLSYTGAALLSYKDAESVDQKIYLWYNSAKQNIMGVLLCRHVRIVSQKKQSRAG